MNKKLVWLALVAATAGALGFWGCNSNSTNPSGAVTTYGDRPPSPGEPPPSPGDTSPNTITMVNESFSPRSLTVTAGTTVTWKNNDSVTHTSTSDDTGIGAWETGDIPPGGSQRTTFNTVGTFGFHCSIHPVSMTGPIVVETGGYGGY
ncbi:MAG: cupredoxin domain-containing protein [Bacteroidota bacterium]